MDVKVLFPNGKDTGFPGWLLKCEVPVTENAFSPQLRALKV